MCKVVRLKEASGIWSAFALLCSRGANERCVRISERIRLIVSAISPRRISRARVSSSSVMVEAMVASNDIPLHRKTPSLPGDSSGAPACVQAWGSPATLMGPNSAKLAVDSLSWNTHGSQPNS